MNIVHSWVECEIFLGGDVHIDGQCNIGWTT